MSSSLQSLPRPTKTYHAHTYDRIAKHHGFIGRGKTVLITGGAGGVGLSIAQAFAAAGVARIAIVSRSPDAQAKAKAELEAAHPSVQVLTYSTSVTDGTRLSEILLELGTIDVLVLNAAVTHRQVPSIEITEDVVRDTFDINVVTTFNLTKAFLCMPRQGQGQSDPRTVIYVSSAVTQISGRCVAYASSKAAGSQMMQQFAADVSPEEVRIFAVHPGIVYTPGAAQMYPREAMEWEDLDVPGHFALWLAGPESGFLHGRYLWAQWDVDELLALRERVEKDPSFLKIGLVL